MRSCNPCAFHNFFADATGTPPTQPVPSASQTVSTPPIITNTAPNTTGTAEAAQGGSSGPNAGAIAGGVVGGIAFIALVALFLVWRRMKKRNSMSKDLTFSPQDLVAEKPLQPAQTGTTVTYNSSGPYTGRGSTVVSQYVRFKANLGRSSAHDNFRNRACTQPRRIRPNLYIRHRGTIVP